MSQAKKGDRVSIHFIGRLQDGTIFDSTHEMEPAEGDSCENEEHNIEPGPVELLIGDNEFFTQIEDGIIGMKVGDKKTVAIPADDAFGEHDDENIFSLTLDQIPEDFKPVVGEELELTSDENDESEVVTVIAISDTEITFDANHPFTGQDLTYEIELLEIL
ncbi:MAG: peptidylprolyl isomerase [Desulfobacteraceae bacterium 4572_35.2]|jgi:peptidylprolyl isomerase|nr:MAG: peptidylprolyl isomerase [Desulfobacteraceae bacterium 4572_35.2]